MFLIVIMYSFLIFILFLCSSGVGTEVTAETSTLYTSQVFFIPINKSRFVPGFTAVDEVEYMPSVSGMPELPDWMFYRFDNESRTGFLYGSPTSSGNVEIQVIALNTHTFETQRDSLKLAIIERDSKSPNLVSSAALPLLFFPISKALLLAVIPYTRLMNFPLSLFVSLLLLLMFIFLLVSAYDTNYLLVNKLPFPQINMDPNKRKGNV